jgi:hypothetical protein
MIGLLAASDTMTESVVVITKPSRQNGNGNDGVASGGASQTNQIENSVLVDGGWGRFDQSDNMNE